jgi:flavin reductase (DIM6/NTAB) family NADH-FMN oxidoreductase RutF
VSKSAAEVIELDASRPVWDRCFMVAPLVLIGTRDEDGSLDLAPKHMAFPLGWKNYFGFVCSPKHHTCANIERNGEFTVTFCRRAEDGAAEFRHVPGEEDRRRVHRGRVPVSRMQTLQDDRRLR